MYVSGESSILVIDLTTMLVLQEVVFELSIRSISLFYESKDYLFVMPYDNLLFVLEFSEHRLSRYSRIRGHNAFIMEGLLYKGSLVTAGADHRVCISSLDKIQIWGHASSQ